MLFRQVAIGRAQETPQDLRDVFLALINGDVEQAKTVLSQRGSNVDASAGGGLVASDTSVGASTPLVAEVEKLGNAARGYKLGATGPEYYDCSGLIWRACKNLGLYTGVRFTTHSFVIQSRGWCEPIKTPSVGDIVLWQSRHMGVCVGNDRMYSARSVNKGIGESSISGDSSYFGHEPKYFRVVS